MYNQEHLRSELIEVIETRKQFAKSLLDNEQLFIKIDELMVKHVARYRRDWAAWLITNNKAVKNKAIRKIWSTYNTEALKLACKLVVASIIKAKRMPSKCYILDATKDELIAYKIIDLAIDVNDINDRNVSIQKTLAVLRLNHASNKQTSQRL